MALETIGTVKIIENPDIHFDSILLLSNRRIEAGRYIVDATLLQNGQVVTETFEWCSELVSEGGRLVARAWLRKLY